jgi:hypothetical protein
MFCCLSLGGVRRQEAQMEILRDTQPLGGLSASAIEHLAAPNSVPPYANMRVEFVSHIKSRWTSQPVAKVLGFVRPIAFQPPRFGPFRTFYVPSIT